MTSRQTRMDRTGPVVENFSNSIASVMSAWRSPTYRDAIMCVFGGDSFVEKKTGRLTEGWHARRERALTLTHSLSHTHTSALTTLRAEHEPSSETTFCDFFVDYLTGFYWFFCFFRLFFLRSVKQGVVARCRCSDVWSVCVLTRPLHTEDWWLSLAELSEVGEKNRLWK